MKKEEGNRKDVFKEFQESIKGLDGALHIIDTTISVDKQMEYFKFAENVKKELHLSSVEEQIMALKINTSTYIEIKYALAYLAISGDVKAYRALETYNKTPEGESSDWAKLALLQAKITLQSEFSEEKQIFISTGLGGRDSMIRFFSFFKSTELKVFSPYQQDLIAKEMSFAIHKYKGELEKIEIRDNYFTLLFLIDIRQDIRAMLLEAVKECNEYGNFINPHFIVTNVKIYTDEDIQKELLKDEK